MTNREDMQHAPVLSDTLSDDIEVALWRWDNEDSFDPDTFADYVRCWLPRVRKMEERIAGQLTMFEEASDDQRAGD